MRLPVCASASLEWEKPTKVGFSFLSNVPRGRLSPTNPSGQCSKYRAGERMASISPDQAIKAALSAARLGTFEAEIEPSDQVLQRTLALYAWNAQVSAAMLAPLHLCEVVIRNAVSDAWLTTINLAGRRQLS